MTLEKSGQVVRSGGEGEGGGIYRTSEERMVVATCFPSQMNEEELLHTIAGFRWTGVILAWIGIAVNEVMRPWQSDSRAFRRHSPLDGEDGCWVGANECTTL